MAIGRAADPALAESRRLMDEYAKDPDPEIATARELEFGTASVLEITSTGSASDVAVLHLHGGAYRRGAPGVFAAQLALIAKAVGVGRLIGVRYRLAPEHPFPAGLDDALAAYEGLLLATSPEKIVIWGDSAGGGLAAALLLRIAERGLPRPRGAVVISPWADLRVVAASYEQNAATDTLFSRESASEAAEEYLAGQPASDPRISAVLGDWSGQPPLLALASRTEVLRDDAMALVDAALEAGVHARLELFDGVQHIWPIMDFPRTEDAVRAVEVIREFLVADLGLRDALDSAALSA